MTQSTIPEPTLRDVLDKFESFDRKFESLDGKVASLDSKVEHLSNDFEGLKKDVEGFNNRFSDYQQSVQWVVQLAFSLIASATVTIIITSILRN